MAVVFGYAGIIKLLDPESFALAVYRYHLIPGPAVNLVALWLTGVEVVSALALFCGARSRRVALYLQVILLGAFCAGIVINLVRGSSMACGCLSLSPLAMPLGWSGVLKNVFLILVAFVGVHTFRLAKPGGYE
jgi:hypothetical protein